MRNLILLFCILAVSGVNSEECKDVKCPAPPKHYEEFGCTPVTRDGECCPSQFDCSSFKNRNTTLCHYHNQTIEIGDEFHNKDIEASCTIGCRCQSDGDEEEDVASLQCTHIDCPEFFGDSYGHEAGKICIRQYEEKSCCVSKSVCGEALTKLSKCQHDGHSYYEGERIDTGRSCYSCLCGKDWEDKPFEENKHCHKVNCNMELHYYKRMLDGCIPVYYKTDDCCPIQWRCPDNETIVVPDRKSLEKIETTDLKSLEKNETIVVVESSPKPIEKNETSPAVLTCTFGQLKMNLGDFLSPENDYEQCTVCTCKVPPYPHCIKTC